MLKDIGKIINMHCYIWISIGTTFVCNWNAIGMLFYVIFTIVNIVHLFVQCRYNIYVCYVAGNIQSVMQRSRNNVCYCTACLGNNVFGDTRTIARHLRMNGRMADPEIRDELTSKRGYCPCTQCRNLMFFADPRTIKRHILLHGRMPEPPVATTDFEKPEEDDASEEDDSSEDSDADARSDISYETFCTMDNVKVLAESDIKRVLSTAVNNEVLFGVQPFAIFTQNSHM